MKKEIEEKKLSEWVTYNCKKCGGDTIVEVENDEKNAKHYCSSCNVIMKRVTSEDLE